MVDIQHKNITGLDAAHPPFYPSESDPTTTLGAYRGWLKPSTGETWIRNAANTAWLDIVVTGTSTALTAHLADATDAHDASAISILDTGGDFTATNVEGALAELAAGGGVTEIDDLADVDTSTAPPADGQTLIWDDTNSEWIPGSVAAGTVAAADVTYAGGTGLSATDAEAALDELATEKANASDLTDHISDASAAHAASAISYAGGTGMSATNAEAAIDELATEKANDAALTAHIGDTSDAHDASAISYAGGTGMSATDVEAAIDELATEKTDDSALTAHLSDATDAHDASAISILDTGGDFTATDVEGALAELFAGGGGGGVADLDDLTDVDVTTTPPTDGQSLVFDDGDNLWKPATASGGGSGNISGAYDIESGTYTDAGMSDEFESGTLDAQWTAVTGATGTVDPYTNPAGDVWDVTTRDKGLLVQPHAVSGATLASLRQTDGLTSGESIVVSLAIPDVQTATSQTMYSVLELGGSADNANPSRKFFFEGTATYVLKVINSFTAATLATATLAKGDLQGRRMYLRISRVSGDYWWFYSFDGVIWSYLHKETLASTFTHTWLQFGYLVSSPAFAPIFGVNWVRHVASTAYDLW